MSDQTHFLPVKIPPAFAGARVDKALSELLPGYSRAAIQRWFKRERVRVDGRAVAQKYRLAGGETLQVDVPPPQPAADANAQAAQAVALDIIDCDADIVVINKPPGLVVHPGAGHADRTLLNGLGRTHQIRVHLSWRGFPVVGDRRYGGRVKLPPEACDALTDALRRFNRQALHAARLELHHPRSGELRRWRQTMPDDMRRLVEALDADRRVQSLP